MVLPGLNWSDPSTLTLEEIDQGLSLLIWENSIHLIWPHLFRSLAEIRGRNEMEVDLFIPLTNTENHLCVRDVVGIVGTRVRKTTETGHS